MTEVHAHLLVSALLRKGFRTSEGKHHTMLELVAGGKTGSVRTRLSHGQRKVDDWLLSEIAKQLHLSKRELLRLVECEITGEEYVRLMIEQGHIRP